MPCLVAIDRFDLVNESRLATYAIWWIRQAIQRAVAGGAYPVRLNPRQLHQLAQAQAQPGGGGGDDGTNHTFRSGRSGPSRQRSSKCSRPPGPCSRSMHPAGSMAPRPSVNSSFRRTMRIHKADEAQHSVGDLIKTLGSREQLILKLRFGLGGESPRTLIEVSKVLGVSKERVRQIQNRAITKLRSSSSADDGFQDRPSRKDDGRRMSEEGMPSLARKRA